MYHSDQGGYPLGIAALIETEFITDVELARCTKTGAEYCYRPPAAGDGSSVTTVACVDPDTPRGKRPHSFRNSLLVLEKGGRIVEVRR
jgi:hypothetical protein